MMKMGGEGKPLGLDKDIAKHVAWMVPVIVAARSVCGAADLHGAPSVSVLCEALADYDKTTQDLPPIVIESLVDGRLVLSESTRAK